MAEDPKINPSPPPAQPVDVQTLSSAPPAEPFDVKVNLSPPPAQPFDVSIYPDGPPVGVVDVVTSPTPGPVNPVDVSTSPVGPPTEPYDVKTSPDGPPAEPLDVPTIPDGPPITPYDVPTNLDGPPIEAFDVATNPDGPSLAPFDVATNPDGPSLAPFDVTTAPDGPPAVPVDPASIPFDPGVPPLPDPVVVDPASIPFDPGVPMLPDPIVPRSTPHKAPLISDIISSVKGFDSALGSFLAGLNQISPVQISIQGAGALDPTFLAGWFRDYTQAVGPGNVGKFISQQQTLFAMNPVAARVFNTAYFLSMTVPGSMGHVHATIDTQAGINAQTVALLNDSTLQMKVLLDAPEDLLTNVYTPGMTMVDGQEFSVDEMIDASIDGSRHPFMKSQRDATGLVPVKVFDAKEYFNDRDSHGGMSVSNLAKSRVGIENLESREPALAASAFINGIVRVPISANESADGAVYSRTQNPSDIVDDDDARIPLCFTDLRKDPVKNAYRSVFFRPLNLSFSKTISPEWAESSAFGRVDPIVAYQKTSRTYSVSFDLHAFAPEDLEIMYNKMIWLDSMCYPSYGYDSLMKSGPVIRLRIGDAVSTESGGLGGVIKSLSYDFADALWELKKGFKVPRSFKVSLDFLALHEGPVGVVNGTFGVFKLPTSGKEDNTPGQFTNFVSNGIAAAGQPRSQAPKGAEVIPGGFSRFGESRKK